MDETITALKQVFNETIVAEDRFQDKVDEFHFNGYAVVMNTQGSIKGRILIHHYIETAIEIGNRILAKSQPNRQKSTVMDDEISNALAGFALQVMEPAVNKLNESEIDLQFSQAYFISDTNKMSHLLEDVANIITVPIEIEDIGRLYLNYLLYEGM